MPFSSTTASRVPAGTEIFSPFGAVSRLCDGATAGGADVCGPTDSWELTAAANPKIAASVSTTFQGRAVMGNMASSELSREMQIVGQADVYVHHLPQAPAQPRNAPAY